MPLPEQKKEVGISKKEVVVRRKSATAKSKSGYTCRISDQQIAFCEAYMRNGGKCASAAREAGYSTKSANVIGYQLIRKPVVKNYLKDRRAYQVKTMQITTEKKMQLLKEIAENANLHNAPANVAISAISELNKMQGDYAPTKNVNINIETDEHLNQIKKIKLRLDEKRKFIEY